MTTTTVLPTQSYAAGTYNLPETAIGDAITIISIAILRCTSADTTIWPNSTDTISFDLKMSVGGNTNYQEWASGSDSGGIVTSPKTGVQLTTMNFGGSLPPGTNRFLKGSITLSNTIKTGASVTVS